MSERWLPVPGYEGWYEVSDMGAVRSVTRDIVAAGTGITRRYRGKVLRQWSDAKAGYARVCLSKQGHDFLERIHRIVALAFIGEGAPGEVVRHKNGDATDCRAVNLEWGTEGDNMLDAVRHGTHPQARKSHCPRSHPLVEPNLRASVARNGWRGCLACKRAGDYVRTHPEADVQAEADRYFDALLERAA